VRSSESWPSEANCVKTERRCVVTRSSPLWSAENEKIYSILETL
jgi:hypothetical protein